MRCKHFVERILDHFVSTKSIIDYYWNNSDCIMHNSVLIKLVKLNMLVSLN